MKIKVRSLLAFITCISAAGQSGIPNVPNGVNYTLQYSAAPSTSAVVATVQSQATANKVYFVSAYLDSTVACTFTLERNGTAATTTAATISNLNPNEIATTMKGFTASNVGVGTILGTYGVPAGGSIALDLSFISFLTNAGTNTNLTIRTNSITGIVHIIFKFVERNP
ncbi:MAG: hypothetical protein WCC64_00020 [Aliidongia sp.]